MEHNGVRAGHIGFGQGIIVFSWALQHSIIAFFEQNLLRPSWRSL